MGHLWHNLAAPVFMAGVYAAVWEGRRRWDPWATMPTEGSRASRGVKWVAGVLLWAAVSGVLAGALYNAMPFDNWAFIAGFATDSFADRIIETLQGQGRQS
jgi:peptidoglycan/LPS O-acetylase OafA/YrhL